MNAMTTAISLVGLMKLARELDISHQSVRKFEREGVPSGRVLQVAAATNWRVTPHQLRADLYPYPTDGVPPDQRAVVDQLATTQITPPKFGRRAADRLNGGGSHAVAVLG